MLRGLLRMHPVILGHFLPEASAATCIDGIAQRYLAGLDECIGDMQCELLAAHGEPKGRYDIGAANHVEFRPRSVEVPTQLKNVGESLGVIRMHMREEDRIELPLWNADLR